MASPQDDGRRRAESDDDDPRAPMGRRDIVWLVLATYRASLPYFLVFLLGMALATWFVTEVLF